MADHKEVRHEHLWLKEPGTERLRSTAAGKLRHYVTTGWRETDRWIGTDYITVKLERSGVDPRIGKLPKIEPPPPRPPREGGDRGGFGGRGFGGPGRGRGGPGRGAPGAPGGGPGGSGARSR